MLETDARSLALILGSLVLLNLSAIALLVKLHVGGHVGWLEQGQRSRIIDFTAESAYLSRSNNLS